MHIPSFLELSRKLITPFNQILILIGTFCILSALMYKPLTVFNTSDPYPTLVPYVPQKKAVAAESIVPIKVGIYISNFPTFDSINNNFVADMTLWFQFDPTLISIDTVQKCTFDRGTIETKSEPLMKMLDEQLLLTYTLRLKFSTNLNYKLFPLNDHKLFITLKNEYVDPDELIFITEKDYFSINPHANTGDWLVVDHSAEAGYFVSVFDKNDPQKTIAYPTVVFSLDLKKMGIRKIFIILLPMAVLFFIALATFSIDPSSLGRSILALSTGTLTGLIAYRFVIEKIVPDVGYFTFTDHLFNLFLTALFIIFLVNIFAVNRGKNDDLVVLIKGAAFILIQLTVIISFYLLLSKAGLP